MNVTDIQSAFDQYVMNTYTRMPPIFVKGKGSVLTDIHGQTYLDFFPGWGVLNVGHCHPKVMAGIRDQVDTLMHLPNNLYNIPQGKLAKEIVRHSFDGKIFFCNSGTEAAEAAIKIARAAEPKERYRIITMKGSFHGRSTGALAATGQSKHSQAFQPLMEGFDHVPLNDWDTFEKTVTPQTSAVMLELIQGEGGIHIAQLEYIKKLRDYCDQQGMMLIVDEVQTGMGRTGKMFAYQHYGVLPDIVLMAKSLGGGFPIGAVLCRGAAATTLGPGMHGSTFGGSPLACKAALGVFKAIQSEHMLRNANTVGEYLRTQLEKLKNRYDVIREVRGMGLMWGIELTIKGQDIFNNCFQHGLIINCTQDYVLRIMPALNVTKKQIDKAIHILDEAIAQSMVQA